MDNEHYERLAREYEPLAYHRDLSDCSERSEDNNTTFCVKRDLEKRVLKRRQDKRDLL